MTEEPPTEEDAPIETCPGCGSENLPFDEEDEAEEYDIIICYGCGKILQYDEELVLQLFSDEELSKLPDDVQKDLKTAQLEVHKQRPN